MTRKDIRNSIRATIYNFLSIISIPSRHIQLSQISHFVHISTRSLLSICSSTIRMNIQSYPKVSLYHSTSYPKLTSFTDPSHFTFVHSLFVHSSFKRATIHKYLSLKRHQVSRSRSIPRTCSTRQSLGRGTRDGGLAVPLVKTRGRVLLQAKSVDLAAAGFAPRSREKVFGPFLNVAFKRTATDCDI